MEKKQLSLKDTLTLAEDLSNIIHFFNDSEMWDNVSFEKMPEEIKNQCANMLLEMNFAAIKLAELGVSAMNLIDRVIEKNSEFGSGMIKDVIDEAIEKEPAFAACAAFNWMSKLTSVSESIKELKNGRNSEQIIETLKFGKEIAEKARKYTEMVLGPAEALIDNELGDMPDGSIPDAFWDF